MVQTVADVGGDPVTVFSPSSTSLERIKSAISLVSPVDLDDVKTAKRGLADLGKSFGGRKGGIDTRAKNQAIADNINSNGGNITGGFEDKESRFPSNETTIAFCCLNAYSQVLSLAGSERVALRRHWRLAASWCISSSNKSMISLS